MSKSRKIHCDTFFLSQSIFLILVKYWYIVLDDHWSKKIYRPHMIVDGQCYIHLRWSCSPWQTEPWPCDGIQAVTRDQHTLHFWKYSQEILSTFLSLHDIKIYHQLHTQQSGGYSHEKAIGNQEEEVGTGKRSQVSKMCLR